MPPTKSYMRIIQVGKEAIGTVNTPVAATARLLHRTWNTDDASDVYRPTWQSGVRAQVNAGVVTGETVGHDVQVEATFEQIMYWLEMSMLGGVAPVGAGADKTWTYLPPITGDPGLRPFTVQKRLTDGAGLNIDRRYPTTLASQIILSGDINGVVECRARLFSIREEDPGTFTAAIPVAGAVELMPVWAGKLYQNNTWATVGTTLVSDRMMSFTWTLNTGLSLRRRQNGTLYASGVRAQQRSAELRLVLDSSAESQAIRAAVKSRAAFAFRQRFEGSVVPTTAITKKLDIDGYYTLDSVPAEGDDAGDDTIEFTMQSLVEPTAQQDIRITLVNGVTALV